MASPVRPIALIAAAAALALPAAAHARPAPPIGSGDVNGDGRPDVVLADYAASPMGRKGAGQVEVLFGGRKIAKARRTHLGSRGLLIVEAAAGDSIGAETSTVAGDVNGVGADDMLITSRESSRLKHPSPGPVYVVFGAKN